MVKAPAEKRAARMTRFSRPALPFALSFTRYRVGPDLMVERLR